jgi:hypothetical protein
MSAEDGKDDTIPTPPKLPVTLEEYAAQCVAAAIKDGVDLDDRMKVPAVWEDAYNDGLSPEEAVSDVQFETSYL